MTPILTFSSCVLRGLLMMARECKPRANGGLYVDPFNALLVGANADGMVFFKTSFYQRNCAPFVLPFAECERARRAIDDRDVQITVSIGAADEAGRRALLIDAEVGAYECMEVAGEFPVYFKLIPRRCSGITGHYTAEVQALVKRALAEVCNRQPHEIEVLTQHNGANYGRAFVPGHLETFAVLRSQHSAHDIDAVAAATLQHFGVHYEVIDGARCA